MSLGGHRLLPFGKPSRVSVFANPRTGMHRKPVPQVGLNFVKVGAFEGLEKFALDQVLQLTGTQHGHDKLAGQTVRASATLDSTNRLTVAGRGIV